MNSLNFRLNTRADGGDDYRNQAVSFYDYKRNLDLGTYGFPELAVTNRLLRDMDDYGESREELERGWQRRVHHMPFDAATCLKLIQLCEDRLQKLAQDHKTAEYSRLNCKMRILQNRSAFYDIEAFSPDQPERQKPQNE